MQVADDVCERALCLASTNPSLAGGVRQVFWWLVEGKFGNRRQALAPRLFELVTVAAEKCNEGTDSENPCNDADWDFESPGWALALGITAVSLLRQAVQCFVKIFSRKLGETRSSLPRVGVGL